MAAVVLDIQPNTSGHEAEKYAQRQRLPPGLRDKDEYDVKANETGEQEECLKVEWQTIPTRLAGFLEIRVDSSAELGLEAASAGEFRVMYTARWRGVWFGACAHGGHHSSIRQAQDMM